MNKRPLAVKSLAIGMSELLALYAANAAISHYFPHWIPKATFNGTHREWASICSAASLVGAVASFAMLDRLSKLAGHPTLVGQVVEAPSQVAPQRILRHRALRVCAISVDAASFIWSIRACTDMASNVATVVGALAYLSVPRLLGRPRNTPGAGHVALVTAVKITSALSFACIAASIFETYTK